MHGKIKRLCYQIHSVDMNSGHIVEYKLVLFFQCDSGFLLTVDGNCSAKFLILDDVEWII